jgi:DNA-binding transcriptional MerR regulator
VGFKAYPEWVTTGHRIAEVARRSGFTPATLRYYEEIGLLPAPQRTGGGYRAYDDRALDRLAFITRAKQLGCTLEEIIDLSIAWEGGQCGPIQDRLRTVVAAKLTGAQTRIVELMTLTEELQVAASALELHRPTGRATTAVAAPRWHRPRHRCCSAPSRRPPRRCLPPAR